MSFAASMCEQCSESQPSTIQAMKGTGDEVALGALL
jgi:hypothetical protein